MPSSSLRRSSARVGATACFEVAEHVLGLVEARLLRHVADGEARRQAGGAEEVLVFQGHDAQQPALAGAVAADDADLGAGIEGQPDVLEDLALAVGFGEAFDGENVLFRHGPFSLRNGFGTYRFNLQEARGKVKFGQGDKGTRGQGDKGTRGQGDKGTRGQGDKGTRGQGDKEGYTVCTGESTGIVFAPCPLFPLSPCPDEDFRCLQFR